MPPQLKLHRLLPIILLSLHGDITPKSLLGRLATVPISLIGFMVIGSISGVVASLMTIDHLSQDINSLQDLRGQPVAIKQGTATEEHVSGQGLELIYVQSNQEAYDMAESGRVAAFVHDAPALRYYANNEGAGKVDVVGNIFSVQYYGIALPQESDLRETINRAQLQLSETGITEGLKEKYGI